MTEPFKIGDHVTWNSDVGRVHGHITKIHTRDTEFMGKMRRATPEEPQYEVQSDKTDKLALHKGEALRHLPK